LSEQITHKHAGPAWSGVGDADTLLDIFVPSCLREPDLPAIIFEDGPVVTRAALLDCAASLAGYLSERISAGEAIAVMLENRAEYMIAHLASAAVRAILVSVNPSAKAHDTTHVLRDSGAVLAIADGSNSELIEGLRDECPQLREVLTLGDAPEPDGLAHYRSSTGPLDLEHVATQRSDICHIYYTSGTTGLPKGCMLDHEWWLRVVDIELRLNPKEHGERMLSCLPFYYADPAVMLASCINSGATLVAMRRFSVSRFWDVVRAHDVSDMWTIASMPALLLKAVPDPKERDHHVRRAVAVGVQANIHREIVDRFGFPFLDNYGSTEATINTRMPTHVADEMVGSGSMGVAVPECEMRILGQEGHELAIGETGELSVWTPGLFRGYVNRPEEFAEVVKDGWFHTGDLVSRDERGFYYFKGRKKDIIRRIGENVAAAEVEEVIRSHPKVMEVAVIPVPDDLRGEEVKAYILPLESESSESLPPEEIIAWCAERLAPFKVPRYLEYRDTDFPRTASLRVKKDELKSLADLVSTAWDREAQNGG
jgi:crotonobetaine/carnitine-CoA ligase